MSKYDPLAHFLERSAASEIWMTFEEIEGILGFPLPPSQTHRAWWSNNASNNVMTKAWLAAGYETEQVDIEGRKLVFRRVARVPGLREPGEGGKSAGVKQPRRNPLFGFMAGTFTIAPGTDLTAPADGEWADMAWGKSNQGHEDAA
ncbi:MAG: hypothetical protein P0Y66_20815 [Candidatus Kaistia colombiensis]|nr:MAG: hypothetical protein P0Y66_20815 [Kaistia sp.]